MSEVHSHPLQRAFLELRNRDLPLGLEEYLLLLKALSLGLCGTSRAQLVSLCQSLWAHSRQERALVAVVLERVLPVEFVREDLESWLEELSQGESEPATQDRTPGESTPEDPVSRDHPESAAPSAERPAPERTGPAPSSFPDSGVVVRRSEIVELGPRLAAQLAVARQRYELEPQPPVPERQMRRAWRYYRKARRIGPKVTLDIEDTIRRVCRDGVLVEPVLVPRAINAAALVVLQDVKGSMVPFQWQLEHLVSSVTVSGIRRLERYYFHDVPGERLGLNPSLSKFEETQALLERHGETSLLILSDGGAARGHLDAARIQATRQFLDLARLTTDNLAWINPMPVSRWTGTTAEAIRQIPVPMFPFNRSGLFDAIDALRGRVRVSVV